MRAGEAVSLGCVSSMDPIAAAALRSHSDPLNQLLHQLPAVGVGAGQGGEAEGEHSWGASRGDG